MGLILKGILRMPMPDNPEEIDLVSWGQVKGAMRDAADALDRLEFIASVPSDLHPEKCDCVHCVPF